MVIFRWIKPKPKSDIWAQSIKKAMLDIRLVKRYFEINWSLSTLANVLFKKGWLTDFWMKQPKSATLMSMRLQSVWRNTVKVRKSQKEIMVYNVHTQPSENIQNNKVSLLTCSRHQNLQNIRIPVLQIFVFVYWRGTGKTFYWSKIFFGPMKMFSCPPSINKNKDLENWNSNILEGLMSWTSYSFQRGYSRY